MRKYARFWWGCANLAARGPTIDANNWQWLIGIPLVAGLASYLFNPIDIAKMAVSHPILNSLIVAAAAFAATWLVSFLVRCAKHPADMYFEQRTRADKLEARLVPKMAIVYDRKIPSCRSITSFTNQEQGICFRLEVENTGNEPIEDCEGYLVEGRRIDDPQESLAYKLTWADSPSSTTTSVRLLKGVKRYLDVVRVMDSGTLVPATERNMWPINRQDMLKEGGEFIFSVILHGSSCASLPPYSLRLTHTGSWEISEMVVI